MNGKLLTNVEQASQHEKVNKHAGELFAFIEHQSKTVKNKTFAEAT